MWAIGVESGKARASKWSPLDRQPVGDPHTPTVFDSPAGVPRLPLSYHVLKNGAPAPVRDADHLQAVVRVRSGLDAVNPWVS
jgi:hypothetical protein